MTAIDYTNNMSWCIKDEDNPSIQLDGFISPADVISGTTFSYGYTAEIYYKTNDGEYEQLSPLKYAFDYYSGILTFNSEISYAELVNYNQLYFTGFRYIRKICRLAS